jgi:hypothetical protein
LVEQDAGVSETSDSSRRRPKFVIGCGLLILLCLVVFFFIQYQFSAYLEHWNRDLATLMATDDTIAEFGDGGHPISITPSAAFPVGTPITLNNLRITVTSTGELTDYQGSRWISDDYTFWEVEFTLKNISNHETEYVNPKVDSQMQYLRGTSYRRDLGFATIDPTLLQGVIEMAPETQLQGILIYEVPRESNELFWVYIDTGYTADCIVFKVK